MPKVVSLNKQDVLDLVRIRLMEQEQNQPTELSDTKSELNRQAQNSLTQMLNSEELGVIVSLFIMLLTDRRSEMAMRQIGAKYDDFLDKKGNPIDFTRKMSTTLRPFTERFIDSLINTLGKQAEDTISQKLHNTNPDPKIQELNYDLDKKTKQLNALTQHIKKNPKQAQNPKYLNAKETLTSDIESIKQSLHLKGEGLDTTKNQLRRDAIERINHMSTNPSVMKVFSIFLMYLTDKDSMSSLKSMGSTYGKKLKALVNQNSEDWTMNLLNRLRPQFNNMMTAITKAVTGEKIEPVSTTDKPNVNQDFDSDQMKAKDIMKRYNLG